MRPRASRDASSVPVAPFSNSTVATKAVVDRAAGNERADGRADRFDLADEMAREVDRMRAEVAERAGAGDRRVEMPVVRGRVPAPGLEVAGAEVDDLAELSGLDELACEPDRRDEAVVEAGGVDDSCVLGRAPHRVRLVGRERERLLAEDVLASARGGDRRLGVKRVRPAVHEEADALVGDLLPPVRRRLGPAEARPCLLERVRSRPEIETSSGSSAGSSCRTAASARECALPMKR